MRRSTRMQADTVSRIQPKNRCRAECTAVTSRIRNAVTARTDARTTSANVSSPNRTSRSKERTARKDNPLCERNRPKDSSDLHMRPTMEYAMEQRFRRPCTSEDATKRRNGMAEPRSFSRNTRSAPIKRKGEIRIPINAERNVLLPSSLLRDFVSPNSGSLTRIQTMTTKQQMESN